MIKTILRLAITNCIVFALPAAFACDYPDRPHIPDGSTATKAELLQAKNDVQDYLASVDEYLRCVEADERAKVEAMDNPGPDVIKEHDEALSKKFDAANEEKALVGEQFNQQVRAYNKRIQEESANDKAKADDDAKAADKADSGDESKPED
ncbi:MAG: hypothetical protein WB812_07170 [Woeseiaceae bacterium]